jgi:short-subunit dehydrogenase
MKNTALITGATSGIGKELARIHASKGGDLIIVARREDELEKLKSELESHHNIEVHIIVADLMKQGAGSTVYQEIQSRGLKVDILMNNAGLGGYGNLHERSLQKELEMMQLNMIALVELTHCLLPEMIKNGNGKILNTSSSAGFLPGPLQTTYFATKAFVNSFSFGLDQEVRRHGVTVTALCPGPVKTGFEAAAGMGSSDLFKRAASASSTALKGYAAMEKGKLVVITDGPMKFLINFMLPILPRRTVLKMVEKLQTVK